MRIREAGEDDPARAWIEARWGGGLMVVHGERFDLTRVPCLVAEADGTICGALTYQIHTDILEVVSLDADPPGRGIGRQLVDAVADIARGLGLRGVQTTTTNDNLTALGFWQARGFRLVALRPDAVVEARRLKPSIPMYGERGLPVRDEIDLLLPLAPRRHGT